MRFLSAVLLTSHYLNLTVSGSARCLYDEANFEAVFRSTYAELERFAEHELSDVEREVRRDVAIRRLEIFEMGEESGERLKDRAIQLIQNDYPFYQMNFVVDDRYNLILYVIEQARRGSRQNAMALENALDAIELIAFSGIDSDFEDVIRSISKRQHGLVDKRELEQGLLEEKVKLKRAFSRIVQDLLLTNKPASVGLSSMENVACIRHEPSAELEILYTKTVDRVLNYIPDYNSRAKVIRVVGNLTEEQYQEYEEMDLPSKKLLRATGEVEWSNRFFKWSGEVLRSIILGE